MSQPSVQELEAYIRQAAQSRGIDPDTAVRVARSEGLAPGVWQSNVTKGGRREPSYGPYQLLVGGGDTGFPTGMGNDFVQSTGKHPSDPTTAYSQIDFALDRAKSGGWSPWYGAKAVGVGQWAGIKDGGADPYAAMADGPKGQETYKPPVFGSMAPGGGGSDDLMGGAGGMGGMSPDEASAIGGLIDGGGKNLGDRLSAAGAEFSRAMAPPRHGGGMPMPRAPEGNALLDVLSNPTVADMLLKRRLGFLA